MNLNRLLEENLLSATLDLESELIHGANVREVHLNDLRNLFENQSAVDSKLLRDDPVVYRVASIEAGNGVGDLHWGIGMMNPGKIGEEYYFTKGHFHSWREASEVYIGLKGDGMMLLQDENSGESCLVPLGNRNVVFVPGYTAHRTINVGSEPLVWAAVYPAKAGHDYGSLSESNFGDVVVEIAGEPQLCSREHYRLMNPSRKS